jgi:NADH-quinone oxidoreductase subunit N
MIESVILSGVLSGTGLGSQTAGGSGGCTIAPGGIAVHGLCTAANSLHIPVAYSSILPVLVLSIGALVLLGVSAVLPKRSRPGLYPALTVVVGGGSLGTSLWQWYNVPGRGQVTIGGQVFFDHFAALFSILISVAVILSSIASDSYLRREGLDGVEAYVLMLMSATGAVLMAESASLIMLFLGLEIMSIALYVMSAYHRRRTQSGEAGLKYFLLGSFSSALFLYGIALVYGATGTTEIVYIDQFLTTNILANNGILLAGMALLIVGLGFKVAAVPFHFWTPDVYQGAPTPFTGYMAAVAKAAGFAGLLRVLTEALTTEQTDWRPIIWVMAVLTMVVGSVLAIASRDLKRMLAYSSISQAGYVLVGVQAGSTTGTAAALFYLFTYTFIVIGSFAVVDVVQGAGEAHNRLGAIRGLSRRQPLLAASMLVLLLAQAGVPFTSGFLGKFYVIQASVQRGQYYLAVIAMIAAAVAAFFYLRVALLMYTSAPVGAGGSAGVAAAEADVESEADLFGAGLAPIPSLDGSETAAVALALDAQPAEPLYVPSGTALVVFVSVVFTIAAGVSSFAIDFAKAATAIL